MTNEVAQADVRKKIHSGDDDEQDDLPFSVVTDFEERYSIWPQDEEIPKFWKAEGFKGTKRECLDYIEHTWTDMRPLSLRLEMEKHAEELNKFVPSEEKVLKIKAEIDQIMSEGIDHFHKPQPPNEFVRRLMKRQPVEIIRYRDKQTGEPDAKKLTSAINRGYVLVRFPWTQGGTELGASLDTTGTGKPDPGSFEFTQDGKVSMFGRLKLDYTPVRLHAIVDLETFEGEGWLEVIPNWKSPQEYRNDESLAKMLKEQQAEEEKNNRVEEVVEHQ